MSQFTFVTDAESEAYCLEIAASLVQQFGITDAEAIGRINQSWAGQALLGPLDWVYHEVPRDQARFIYYKPGVYWWLEGADLSPRPYPEPPNSEPTPPQAATLPKREGEEQVQD